MRFFGPTFSGPLSTIPACMLPELNTHCFTPNRLVWSLPVTWQRWRSHHSIRHSRKPHAVRKLYGSIFYRTGVIGIEVLHCRNSEFRVFLRKIVENIKIYRSYRTSDADDAETHFLVHYRQFQLVCCRNYTHSRCCFTPNQLVWSLPVTWQRWRSHCSIRSCRKPPAIRKLDVSIFYRTGVIADWRFTLRE